MIADELEKLDQLRAAGELSDEEYERAKAKVLAGSTPPPMPSGAPPRPGSGLPLDLSEPTYCMLLHLSQFAGAAGGLGVVVPIILWVLGKDKSAEVDWHGRMVMNFMLSLILYGFVGVVLSCLGVGVILVVAVAVVAVVFPIIGAIKANEGQRWHYPLTIPFLPLP